MKCNTYLEILQGSVHPRQNVGHLSRGLDNSASKDALLFGDDLEWYAKRRRTLVCT